MARYACPHCSLVMEDDGSLAGRAVSCPECRSNFVWPGSAPSAPLARHVHMHFDNTSNAGIAAVLSLFWPGAGQIYNGAIATGLIVMLMWMIAVFLSFFCVGLVFAIPLWIWSIYDAYRTAERKDASPARWH